ncbi:MAG: hypothetical protein ACYT04_47745 [Nostoc sp.]
MKFFHTGVPLLYANKGVCTPNFTPRSHDNDQKSYKSINSYIAIYHSSWCKSQAIAFGGAA